ncbi:MAG: hypothetical protein KGI70_00460 [Patescibacteria group bacterium]|nr:hypothetical protein [Patescibacteria group bacterium]
MSRNPLINALAASAYVSLVALGIMHVPEKQPMLAALGPLIFLSVFVFSAGLIGYLFCMHPLLFALRGEQRAGIVLFLKTLGFFALITLVLVAAYAALL